ncbi:hypothetical protein AMAG_13882 [Allomyces macrogynus ATCC 38327]|uniref:Uncharacterized protein n=1 Tax=Allomyces macrogynus (strain ATCC 38327) TaxID=578462 RepID=A0A0L0T2T8_ALLM3|nr:hypothetical protein AMAG_13882 [Allomyces macrogynus ATCC 38327]|eukprot:KNE69007.1 hypothetical protein AMAG_13882 [Allomyces macrogynus ATCC 38327]
MTLPGPTSAGISDTTRSTRNYGSAPLAKRSPPWPASISSNEPPVRRTRGQLAAAATKAVDVTKPQELSHVGPVKLADRVRDAFELLNYASAPDSVGLDAKQLKEFLSDMSDGSTLAAVFPSAEPDLLAHWVFVARTASVVVEWACDERPVVSLARVLKHVEARLAGTTLLARTVGTAWTEVWFEVGVGHVIKVLFDVEDGCLFQAVHERTLIHALGRLHQAIDAAAATDSSKAVTMVTVASDALHALFALIRTTHPDPWHAHALPLAHIGLHFLHIAFALPCDSQTYLQRTWGHLLRLLASVQRPRSRTHRRDRSTRRGHDHRFRHGLARARPRATCAYGRGPISADARHRSWRLRRNAGACGCGSDVSRGPGEE